MSSTKSKFLNGIEISTIDCESWMNEPIIQGAQRSKKRRTGKENVNQIFADCSFYINDKFWVDKLNSAARGKFPKGFNYQNGALIYRKGAKSHQIEISDDPSEAVHQFIEFLRNNAGIFSQTDQHQALELEYCRSTTDDEEAKDLTWGECNKKIQDCMLNRYFLAMKSVMNLTQIQLEQLRQTVRLAISAKFFGRANIVVENNKIQAINGLLWDENLQKFYVNPRLKPNTTRSYPRKKDTSPAVDPSQKDTIPQFSLKWLKYVENLDKQIAKNNKKSKTVTITEPNLNIRHLNIVWSTDNNITTTDDYDYN